jgi:hypothetical protein
MNRLLSRKKEQKHYEHRKIKNLKVEVEVNQIMKNKILEIKKQQVKANNINRKYLRLELNKLKHIILLQY